MKGVNLSICKELDCLGAHYALGVCNKHYQKMRRTGVLETRQPRRDLGLDIEETLRAYTTGSEDVGGCWEWTRGRDRGYGKIYWEGRHWHLHRLVYHLYFRAIPEGVLIRHRCDNPPCANPHHLEEGLPADNSRDMVERGRSVRGEGVNTSRLTVEDVASIRRKCLLEGQSRLSLANSYGVGRSAIDRCVNGETWSHVPMPSEVQE